MALTTQAVYSGVSFTAAQAAGNNFVTINIAAQTWVGFTLQGKIVNTSAAAKSGENLTIFMAQSTLNSTTETIAQVKPSAVSFNIPLTSEVSATQYITLPPQVRTGDYLYIWTNHENWDAARTLTLNAVQANATG